LLISCVYQKGDSSDEETSLPARSNRVRNGEGAVGKEELDSSHLIGTEEASKKFRKAERRHGPFTWRFLVFERLIDPTRADRPKTRYTYPPSPTSPSSPSSSKPATLPSRLKLLQAEITALEAEIADPSNPLLAEETAQDHVDLGELIRGVVDVKSRLNRIRKDKEGRGRLVNVILGEKDVVGASPEVVKILEPNARGKEKGAPVLEVKSIAELDGRVRELENIVGSSTTAVDEVSLHGIHP
jgi:nuclear migration protein JNM1